MDHRVQTTPFFGSFFVAPTTSSMDVLAVIFLNERKGNTEPGNKFPFIVGILIDEIDMPLSKSEEGGILALTCSDQSVYGISARKKGFFSPHVFTCLFCL